MKTAHLRGRKDFDLVGRYQQQQNQTINADIDNIDAEYEALCAEYALSV